VHFDIDLEFVVRNHTYIYFLDSLFFKGKVEKICLNWKYVEGITVETRLIQVLILDNIQSSETKTTLFET
jgi:hypothetical protein